MDRDARGAARRRRLYTAGISRCQANAARDRRHRREASL